MHGIRHVDKCGVIYSDIGGIMHWYLLRHCHRVGYDSSVMDMNIRGIMHRYLLCHRIGYDSGVMHGVWHVDVCSVMHGIRHIDKCGAIYSDIGGIVHRYLLRHCHRVGYDSGVMDMNIRGIMHWYLLRHGYRVGYDSSVMHGIRHIDVCGVMHMHCVDPDGSRCWCRCWR